jgi:ankyrin repeat protein
MCDWSETAYTALHYALVQGHSMGVRLLLQHNTDFDKMGLDGMTALHLAA